MLRVINKSKLTEQCAYEMAARQNEADWWYYVLHDQEMSSYILDTLVTFHDLINRLGIFDNVYRRALEIYDFSQSGRDGYVPDLDIIERFHDDFESHRKSSLLF